MSNLRDTVGLRIPYGNTPNFHTEFEPASGTIWGYMNPKDKPCFTLGLLKDIRAHDAQLQANGGRVLIEGVSHSVRYYVGASRIPGIYNLGGDLALFILLIKARDRDALARYARMCVDNLHPRTQDYGCATLTTISLVHGDALGGGFECALSSDVIVAEESALMGMPEILFNLFPGMGAYSLLARRIGPAAAEKLILSGRVLPAAKLYELGVVDVLAKDGEGEPAVQKWIANNAHRRNATQGVFRARQLVHPITRGELDAITDVWVEAALRLGERDMRMMSWLVSAQQQRMQAGEGAAPSMSQSNTVAV
jgi:DSF synthase